MSNIWPPYVLIPEPILRFHISDKTKVSASKIGGLYEWGPLDASYPVRFVLNPIKICVVAPKHKAKVAENLLRDLLNPFDFEEQDFYLKTYPGFRRIYGVGLEIECLYLFEWENTSIEQLFRIYANFIDKAKGEHSFDILIAFFPKELEGILEKNRSLGRFYLHDRIKLFSAVHSVKIQLIRESKVPDKREYSGKMYCRYLWWLSSAIYVKSGGVLHSPEDISERVLYVGLSYAIPRSGRIIIGVSQLFDEYGNSIKIDLFPTPHFFLRGPNPYLNERGAHELFSRILEHYRRVRGKFPSKVIVHKTTPFKSQEINGIYRALRSLDRVELLWLQRNHPFRSVRFYPLSSDNPPQPHGYPVLRGTTVLIESNSFLLWTSGSIETNGLNYYQEGRYIPIPLLVTRFRGNDTLEEVAYDILKLTKLNWNNLQYYNKLPVTIDFASRIARISKLIENIRDINTLPHDFRFYI